jgi:hypothetical protein
MLPAENTCDPYSNASAIGSQRLETMRKGWRLLA